MIQIECDDYLVGVLAEACERGVADALAGWLLYYRNYGRKVVDGQSVSNDGSYNDSVRVYLYEDKAPLSFGFKIDWNPGDSESSRQPIYGGLIWNEDRGDWSSHT